MGIILNRRRVCGGKALPYDAEVEYLESSGTQWIDTLISQGNSFESAQFTIDLQFTNTSGRQVQGSVNSFYCGVNNSRWEVDYNNYYGNADTNRHIYSKRYVVLNNMSYFYVYLDSVLLSSIQIPYNTNRFLNTVVLFGMLSAPTNCKEKIFSANIYRNDVLVRDYIPVRVGQVGYMYDKVSKQLFGNAGTGSFILGSDKDSTVIITQQQQREMYGE